MLLSDLIPLLDAKPIGRWSTHLSITGAQDDSRQVQVGDIFVAVRGLNLDGHDYVDVAIQRGACAIVTERQLAIATPQLLVEDSSSSLGILAAHFAGCPGRHLTNIGITGTNGKTTTAYLVEAITRAAGHNPGLLGTISYRWGDHEIVAPYTTPTPLILQETFAAMHKHGCDVSILEVSSAALQMNRLAGTFFQVAAYSNLSQDHLDVHKTFERYRDAKAQLFRNHLTDHGLAVINIDDENSHHMVRAANKHDIVRVSSHDNPSADIRVVSHTSDLHGIEADILTPRGVLSICSPVLIGKYNVDNIALAVGIAEALHFSHEAIIQGIAEMNCIPGRVERVANTAGLDIIVDYAHTPDALTNILAALRPLTTRRLICVFGCGGDRDPSKRKAMGTAVAMGADLAIITSDNPRCEDPQSILDTIVPAVPNAFFVHVDRRTSIRAAIEEATPGDVVLIAGKGHETYQTLGTGNIQFDDREEAAAACSDRQFFSVRDILSSTQGDLVSGSTDDSFSRIIIDSRSAAPGDLYIAIRGERVDGHDYCQHALDAGARGVVVARGQGSGLVGVVLEVDDPRVALGQIARFHRERWDGVVIGITGSSGKTTTKALLAASLRSSGPVHAAANSNNNETGVPLTLLGLRSYHEFAVIEMGMRSHGEIDYLTTIALPTVQLVINAGTAHLGQLGSTDAIARAKGEIFGNHYGNSIAIYPFEDQRLADLAQTAHKQLSFGDATNNQPCTADLQLLSYSPRGVHGSFLQVCYQGQTLSVTSPLVGKHNAINACAAILAAIAAGATPQSSAAAIATATTPPMRGEITTIAERNVFLDCYNANPTSVQAALQTLAELRGDYKAYAVLGDMLELGDNAAIFHRKIGCTAAKLHIPIVALGEFRDELVSGAKENSGTAWSVQDPAAAARAVLAASGPNDWILLKGSRKMKLERVAEALRKESAKH